MVDRNSVSQPTTICTKAVVIFVIVAEDFIAIMNLPVVMGDERQD